MRLLGRLRASTPEPAFSNVLTPDRIPKFCIPPRLPASYAPESPPPVAALPRRCAAEPDLWPRGADDSAGHTDWDPRSQAALSLPHLPRALTAYGFCALLESPHTRRKESLFLGGPAAARLVPQDSAPASAPALPALPAGPRTTPDAPAPPARARRLLRAPERLLSRALRARTSRGLVRAPSVSSGDGDEDEERGAVSGPPSQAPSASPPPPPCPGPRPERLEAEGTVALGRAGGALRLAAEYSRASGRLRVRLLGTEGLAAGAAELPAVGCRVSFVLRPPGPPRSQRSAVVRRSRKAAFHQDLCLDGLSEEQVRRLAVRVKAEQRGRGLERGRPLGQGELLLGSLLLP
ncbi:C2 calcium-dependent domain-containing protein 4B [Neofelis nebulosa]|uniref:C2 calcium-dependent domain-containing protein 4B n=1 Tax=Neofelis nebulosa TaxID=61452 RepID=UPI00272C2BB9|nr:C2 calcium-dependent domain-containing protein 4B [Neofelis nebulosa]